MKPWVGKKQCVLFAKRLLHLFFVIQLNVCFVEKVGGRSSGSLSVSNIAQGKPKGKFYQGSQHLAGEVEKQSRPQLTPPVPTLELRICESQRLLYLHSKKSQYICQPVYLFRIFQSSRE